MFRWIHGLLGYNIILLGVEKSAVFMIDVFPDGPKFPINILKEMGFKVHSIFLKNQGYNYPLYVIIWILKCLTVDGEILEFSKWRGRAAKIPSVPQTFFRICKYVNPRPDSTSTSISSDKLEGDAHKIDNIVKAIDTRKRVHHCSFIFIIIILVIIMIIYYHHLLFIH